jgi:hypothetical protein
MLRSSYKNVDFKINGCVDNNGYTNDETELSSTAKSEIELSELTSTEIASNEPEVNQIKSSEVIYKSYSQRWWLLASVALLNIANYAHWISFASVNSKAAVFYQVKHLQKFVYNNEVSQKSTKICSTISSTMMVVK